MTQYKFNDDQKKQTKELPDKEYDNILSAKKSKDPNNILKILISSIKYNMKNNNYLDSLLLIDKVKELHNFFKKKIIP